MIEWSDTGPDVNVQEGEYKRLLGFPPEYVLEGRTRELVDCARGWYAENGRPWIYAREVKLALPENAVRLDGMDFTAKRLHEQLNAAEAERAMVVAVSAGKQCEEKAQELWREEKPDEYFFWEVFGSAVVEQLVTNAGARICSWAEENGMAVLPHYSPGYSGWETAGQNRLFEVIQRGADCFEEKLRVLESGMLQPKKSLLAVFGITRHVGRVRSYAELIPCENCSFSPCRYRRTPYQHALPQIEDLRQLQSHDGHGANGSTANVSPLNLAARYSVNPRALRKWSQERLVLQWLNNGMVEARFRYEGTTCSNLGRPLAYDYVIKLDATDYRILAATCASAPGDTGHAAMCEFINNDERLSSAIATENPLAGKSLNDVLMWKRAFSPAGCYCDAESRMHKWGLVLEVIHYALAKREQETIRQRNSAISEPEFEAQAI
jgi:hypothetical protein